MGPCHHGKARPQFAGAATASRHGRVTAWLGIY